MIYAIVENNKIINVIKWDGIAPLETTGEKINISELEVKPGVGWDYFDGAFIDNRPRLTDEDDEPSEPKEEEGES